MTLPKKFFVITPRNKPKLMEDFLNKHYPGMNVIIQKPNKYSTPQDNRWNYFQESGYRNTSSRVIDGESAVAYINNAPLESLIEHCRINNFEMIKHETMYCPDVKLYKQLLNE